MVLRLSMGAHRIVEKCYINITGRAVCDVAWTGLGYNRNCVGIHVMTAPHPDRARL